MRQSERSIRKLSDSRANLFETEDARSKAERAQKDYEATVLKANRDQHTYYQIRGRFKQECRAVENQRMKYGLGILKQVVDAHLSYFENEKIAQLQTQIMDMNDELDPQSEYEMYLQRTIQRAHENYKANVMEENKSEEDLHGIPTEAGFVMNHYSYQNVFYSVQDAMDITRKLRPNENLKVPLILCALCDKVRQLNGFQTEGIFR